VSDVAAAVERVRERVAAAAERAGRSPSSVRIVGAIKNVPIERIRAAVAAGVTDLGCNRAQDLAQKSDALPHTVCWHYFGTIQTNKVKLLDPARVIHSVARGKEMEALARRDLARDVFVEVNLAGEETKQGVAPDEVEGLLEQAAAFPLLNIRGLMFVAPQAENPEDVRWVFTEGRRLGERYGLHELSMGMSDDFEVAIEEGATIVRIGRAMFSAEES
jgi:PLP dependent protein